VFINFIKAFNESFVNHEKLERWVIQVTKLTAQWVPPIARSRNTLLDNTFKNGPTMLLFTPYNPFLDFNPVYSMVMYTSYYFILFFKIKITNKIMCLF
jgi:hypothetical protein